MVDDADMSCRRKESGVERVGDCATAQLGGRTLGAASVVLCRSVSRFRQCRVEQNSTSSYFIQTQTQAKEFKTGSYDTIITRVCKFYK